MINDIARIMKKVFNKSLSTGSIIMFITKYFLVMLGVFLILYILVHKKENNKQVYNNKAYKDDKDKEGMTNLTPADYPSELNKSIINAKKELEIIKQVERENNCRPVINCRRVGYYCSSIN